MTTPQVHVIHENPEWFPPFAAAFAQQGVPAREWLLTGGSIDLDQEPPEGVYWCRLSASAHTRDHAGSKDYGRAVLRWLESWGRTVIGGSGTLEREVSKVAQHAALRSADVRGGRAGPAGRLAPQTCVTPCSAASRPPRNAAIRPGPEAGAVASTSGL